MGSDSDEPETPEQDRNNDKEYYTSDEGVDDAYPPTPMGAETEADFKDTSAYGFRVVASMSEEQLEALIENLDAQCSLQDTLTITSRMKRINWENVVFDGYGAEDVQAAWLYLKSHTRKFRIMAEVVQEIKLAAENNSARFRCRLIESAPGFPKKPPTTAAALFTREMWRANPAKQTNFFVFQREALEGFHRLDPAKKRDWERKLELAKAEYEKEVKEFYSRYPHYENGYKSVMAKKRIAKQAKTEKAERLKVKRATPKNGRAAYRPRATEVEKSEIYPDAPKLPSNPMGEFIQSKLNKLDSIPEGTELAELKTKYAAKWQRLSDRKKVKWMNHVLQMIQEYLEELELYKKKHPEYTTRSYKLRNHFSKADMEIWAKVNHQPQKPARSVFEMFVQEKLNTPDYADMSTEECRKYAEEEFKNMDVDDREMCKINFRRSVLQYKKEIEKYFDWVPDLLKPSILFLIPKKFRKVLMAHVDKLPETLLLEEEEKARLQAEQEDEADEEEAEPILSSSPKKKRKSEMMSENQHEDVKIETRHRSPKKMKTKEETNGDKEAEEFMESMDGYLNEENEQVKGKSHKRGSKKSKVLKVKLPLKKPDVEEYSLERRATRTDIDDMIRGIFDARPHLGRDFSAFYYYAKFIAVEKVWITQIEDNGLEVTAGKMYHTFLGLSRVKKTLFISQSWKWHQRTNYSAMRPEDNYYPGEPKPPHKNAEGLFLEEMKLFQRRRKLMGRIPEWRDIGEDRQNAYMKRHYRDTVKYAQKYENFMMKLSPYEFTAYTILQSKLCEERTLSKNSRLSAWRGYIFPFPTGDLYSEQETDGDSEADILPDDAGPKKRLNQRRSILANDSLIKRITQKVTRQEPTIEEMMAETSSSDEEVFPRTQSY